MNTKLLLATTIIVLVSSQLYADDWPQWRGPNRDAISQETGLLKEWPEEGPRLVWTARGAGVGFSSPSIADGRMFLMGDRGEQQFVICYDVTTGKELWAVPIGPQWVDTMDYHGARCTPTVEENRVYALGTGGDLVVLRTTDGKLGWSINILEKFNAANIKWAVSESPLVSDNKLIVMPGGEKATLVALNKLTGETIWTSHNPNREGREWASYASLLSVEVDGQLQIIANIEPGGYGARASDGKFLWSYPMGGASTNTTPVFHDGKVFLTGNYGPGCALVDASSGTAIFANKNLRNHTGGVVYIDGFLYGTSGGFGSEFFTCLDFKTGEDKWKDREPHDAAVAYADGMLYLRNTGGHAMLVKPSEEKLQIVSTFTMTERSGNPGYPHPVIANGKLYLRDQDIVHCYDIRSSR